MNGPRLTALALAALYCGLLLEDRVKYLGLLFLAGAGFWLLLADAGARGWLRREWPLLLAFAGMLLATLLSWLANDRPEDGVKMLGKQARLLLFVPVYICCRRYLTAAHFWSALVGAALVLGAWSLAEGAGVVDVCPGDVCFPAELNGFVSRIQYGSLNFGLAALLLAAWPHFAAAAAWQRGLFYLGLFLLFYGALASGTRTLYLALPPTLLLWCLLSAFQGSLSWRRGVALGAILLAAAALAWPIMQARYANARAEIAALQEQDYDRSQSIGGRMLWWRAAVQVFGDNPVFGAGPRQFRPALHELAKQGRYPSPSAPHHPHNEYLSVAATRGAVGLAALLGLLAVPLWRYAREFFRTRGEPAVAGVLLTAAVAQMALTESVFDLTGFVYFYAVSSGALCALVLPSGQLRDNGRNLRPVPA